MSSRALRKAQKERERLEFEKQQEQDEIEESDVDDDPPQRAAKASVFAMLGEEDGDNDATDTTSVNPHDIPSTDEDDIESERAETPSTPAPKSSAKRKKKKKKKTQTRTVNAAAPSPGNLDEIDLALKSLSTSDPHGAPSILNMADTATLEVCELLCIETQHLQVANEMRRLFGRAAFDADREDQTPSPSRQRLAQGERATLYEAVAGRNSPGGAGLPAMIRRRNIFMPGKEEWPRATGGGLGMEVIEKRPGGVVEYNFVHSKQYQHAQREFETCVVSMDPSLMVNLLRFNPYHVSTLLQVSEIAKQEKDYTTSGDLLERSLFSFGRAVHSTFAANLAQGKARLDFRRPENREFWLACWRYIGNIGMRATWRTAYEWARLLLSLDPERDPYCISLMIDQFALRAHQPRSFLSLARSKFFQEKWSSKPNIQFSTALAARMADSNTSECADLLRKAIEQFPWVAARLFQELSIDKIPKGIWGTSASSDVDSLYCELYVTLALDVWKLPETIAFLIQSATELPNQMSSKINHTPISINEARFVVLTDKPTLIGLLPREITSKIDSMSDPLPPQDSVHSYQSNLQTHQTLSEEMANRMAPEELIQNDPQQFIEEINTLQRFFELVIPGFTPTTDDANNRDGAADISGLEISDELVEQAIARSNLSVGEMQACLRRLVNLRNALVSQPDQRVASQGGDEVVMLENGLARTTLRWQPNRQFVGATMEEDEALARNLMEEWTAIRNNDEAERAEYGGALP